MIELSPGWELTIKRGPDLLIVRVRCSNEETSADPGLADRVWAVMQQHFTNRLVLDLEEIEMLNGDLPGELLRLAGWISDLHGVIRVCGVSEKNEEAFRESLPGKCFPLYRTTADAVFCSWRPTQPR
jgi:hypothetical protein